MPDVKNGDAAPAASAFPFHGVVLGALVPALLFGVATGIVLPIIPGTALRLGADLATAGFVAALLPVGKVLADLPAGALATRIGDHRAMVVASVLGLLALAGTALASALWVLATSVLLLGAATALFHLARHAYLTDVTPVDRRARVLSTLGGVQRLGYFVGPFLGAVVIVSSSLEPAYWSAGLVDAIRTETVEAGSTIGQATVPYLVNAEACVDLDTDHDFIIAEAVLTLLQREGNLCL